MFCDSQFFLILVSDERKLKYRYSSLIAYRKAMADGEVIRMNNIFLLKVRCNAKKACSIIPSLTFRYYGQLIDLWKYLLLAFLVKGE